jgi:tRNA pseudouridine38-40 synthase
VNSGEHVRPARRRIALLLEYDGTEYHGSQYQENGRTIQSELEAAINNLTGEPVRAAFAGRTDAGVHALGQVATFATASAIATRALVGGLNHFLPPDIAVLGAAETDTCFDARHDARSRVYRYVIDVRPVRSPLRRDRVWHVGQRLDVDVMRAAAAVLAGEHDFAAFAGPYDGPTVRTLRRCDVTAHEGGVTVEMEAQAFLPPQVRRIVGPLVEAGRGRVTAAHIGRLLREARPSSAGPAAPACGLYLVSIAYDGLAFEA